MSSLSTNTASPTTADVPLPPVSTTTSVVNASSNSATSDRIHQQHLNSAAAFWEIDLPSTDTAETSAPNDVKSTGTTKKSTTGSGTSKLSSSASSLFLSTWLQNQVSTAVCAAVTKIPLSNALENMSPEQYQQHVTKTFCHNLILAVQCLQVVDAKATAASSSSLSDSDEDDHDDNEGDSYPNKKRRKVIRKQKRRVLYDPYHVWFQQSTLETTAPENNNSNSSSSSSSMIYWDESQDELPIVVGGKLAILSAGGILNALASCYLCRTPVVPANPKLVLQQAVITGSVKEWKQQQEVNGMSSYITIAHIHAIAMSLHGAIAEQVKADIVRTTPMRIQSLLASDLTLAEFQSVRRRLYDTVILGKGVQAQQNIVHDDANDAGVAVAGSITSQQHEIDKYKKCPGCGNNDQSDFVLDRKNGDVICAVCGIVVSESLMHEGSQFRKFEGEVDRNHHGDAANPLYSNAHNMGTSLSGVMPTTGAGLGGRGSGGRKNLETILKNAHAYTELNVSQFGRSDARRTRVGYKDRHKKSAFSQMTHAGDALNLHEAVVQRAKELFAGKEVTTWFILLVANVSVSLVHTLPKRPHCRVNVCFSTRHSHASVLLF
jgi:TFIIB zinc-binding